MSCRYLNVNFSPSEDKMSIYLHALKDGFGGRDRVTFTTSVENHLHSSKGIQKRESPISSHKLGLHACVSIQQ